ncbi:uncharacterized protein [Macrobrachium rosenbergii]|uniref:uncharacterized protein n=1 Tax=Macrobrachium rosenbergii TaxID=79674 RepID=UPI0034D3AB52
MRMVGGRSACHEKYSCGAFTGDTSAPRRRYEDSHHHAIRDIYLLLLHLRPQECWGHIPTPYGHHLGGPTFLHLLHRRHPDLLQVLGGTPAPRPTVLKRLQENSLVVRLDKCTFGVEKVDFLGHEISPAGVRPMASKVDAVKKFPTPKSIKSLQEFLGMVNYYCCFVPDIARIMYPLTGVLKGKPKALMAAPQQQAFEQTKAALARATTSTHHYPTTPLRLTTDASNIACGAVLEQNNSVADALSRVEINSVHLGIDYKDLTKEQAADLEAAAYCMAFTALRYIHVDVVGPLPQSGGTRYLLTVIDHSTRWPEATPMTEASTSACAEALLSSWIGRFGVPDNITTDRGLAFLSELWVSLSRLMGTTLHSKTAYDAASNGMWKGPTIH